LAKEVLVSVGNIPVNVDDLRQFVKDNFEDQGFKFDFSAFDKMTNNPDLWYINQLEDTKIRT